MAIRSTLAAMETSVLARSPSTALHNVRCSETSRVPSEEEEEPSFAVAVPMAGVYVHHYGRRSVVGTPGIALFANPGDVHRTSHPARCGDRTIELSLSHGAAEPFTDVRTGTFPRRVARVPPIAALRIRMFARAAARRALTSLELDEWTHSFVTHLLGSPPTEGHLSVRQRATVDDALEYLGWHFAEDADLLTVAAAVDSSPHHLSRLFRAGTGATLSAHRTELRVWAAVERIAEGATDLAAVACDVGFFDHAHMTRTLRRMLGATPSQIRSDASALGSR